MSTWARVLRWLRLDTESEESSEHPDYDASEREMMLRVRVVEARVEALRAVREEFDRDLDSANERGGTP